MSKTNEKPKGLVVDEYDLTCTSKKKKVSLRETCLKCKNKYSCEFGKKYLES